MSIGAQKHISDVALGTATGAMAVSLTIGQLNAYLQAAAYVAGILSALAATYFYIIRARDRYRRGGRDRYDE